MVWATILMLTHLEYVGRGQHGPRSTKGEIDGPLEINAHTFFKSCDTDRLWHEWKSLINTSN
jgi:hypothetical protein